MDWNNTKGWIKNNGTHIFLFICVAVVIMGFVGWLARSCCGAKCFDPSSSNLKLVIDHDGGADDAMAVFMCILYEKYFNGMKLVALTTTHGNVNESQVFINSQRFLDLNGRRDVPIYRGATRSLVLPFESDFYFGLDGLGDNKNLNDFEAIKAQSEHAAVALIELSKKYTGELVIMAIGPQTNIALAQRLDPGFIGRLAQLYVGAGHIQSDRFPTPEFNAEMDVEAYYIVADTALAEKVTLIPFSQIKLSLNKTTAEWRRNVLGSIDTPIMRALNSYERLSLPTSEAWTLLDPAVAAIVLNENSVEEFKHANNNISLCGSERGKNINELESKDSNSRLVYSFKEEFYKNLLVDIFSAESYVPVTK